MARNLETIWKILEGIKVIFGVTKLENRRLARAQKYFSTFLLASVVLVFLSMLFAFLITTELKWKIYFGILMTSMIMCTSVAIHFLLTIEAYEKVLQWCEDLHSRDFGGLAIFGNTKNTSTKCFVVLCIFFSGISGAFVCFQAVILSLWEGRISNSVMIPAVFGNCLENVFQIVIQSCTAFVMALCAGASMSFLIMVNLHFLALLKLKFHLLRQLTPQLSEKKFDEIVKEIVDLHCELIEQQTSFNDFASYLMIILESMTFFFGLNFWVISFFMRGIIFIAVANIFNCYIYLVPCFMTEHLSDTFDDFQDTIYDLEWYEMRPKQRKTLILVMIMAGRKNLLRCGPFYVINYEALTNLVKRIYNYGLIINTFMAPNGF